MDKMGKTDIVRLLQTENFSREYYELLAASAVRTRREFGARGYIFAQIGIQGGRCQGNCKFCSMADKYYSMESEFEKTGDEVFAEAQELLKEGIDDLFLMTTVGYSLDKFLSIGRRIKAVLPAGKRLVANIGDFGPETARALKEAGYTGAYHIRRLREGVDTELAPAARLATIEAIKSAGLELYYCIEPIGPEHTYEEIADEILFARDLGVGAMAAMRRIAVPGTPLYDRGQISKAELIKIGAVTRLATNPTRSMNIHETVEGSLLAGVNQLYAEVGANPRDVAAETSRNRGLSVADVRALLTEYGYRCGE